MFLVLGMRLGPYEIVAPLGAGGMGEVYRARDTKLESRRRDQGPARARSRPIPNALARFQREAQVLAVAESSEHRGDLRPGRRRRRHARSCWNWSKGRRWPIGSRRGRFRSTRRCRSRARSPRRSKPRTSKGIIHRDLKPANIKLRADGTVKVLDFGLAKLDRAGRGRWRSAARALTQSPTITTPAMTQLGVILGTAAYMSPEQAKGRPADKRSDVWAFGCVLYEMLTGKRAFEGEDVSDTLAAVLRGEPDWTALPADVPLAIRALMQRCLEKDRTPADRRRRRPRGSC